MSLRTRVGQLVKDDQLTVRMWCSRLGIPFDPHSPVAALPPVIMRQVVLTNSLISLREISNATFVSAAEFVHDRLCEQYYVATQALTEAADSGAWELSPSDALGIEEDGCCIHQREGRSIICFPLTPLFGKHIALHDPESSMDRALTLMLMLLQTVDALAPAVKDGAAHDPWCDIARERLAVLGSMASMWRKHPAYKEEWDSLSHCPHNV